MPRLLDVLSVLAVLAAAVGIGSVLYATAVRGEWQNFGIGVGAGIGFAVLGWGCVQLDRGVRRIRRRA